MNVAIPIAERDPDSTVCLLVKCACFALMALDEQNRIKMIDFFDDRERLFDSCDMLVVMEGDEEAAEYVAQGVRVLTAPYGSTVEDIHEAIMFSQLRELG